jgi:hypothetical protein
MNSVAQFESLLGNVRYAWRMLRRSPGYATLAILTLGVGIGANTAIFTVINGVLLRPLPYAHAGQIVHLDQTAAKVGPDPVIPLSAVCVFIPSPGKAPVSDGNAARRGAVLADPARPGKAS